MASRTLTDRLIRSLKTAKSQEDIWDASFPGASFGIRVTSAGKKTFIFRYRVQSKRKRLTIGQYSQISLHQARKEALSILSETLKGEDPQQEKPIHKQAETVSELFEVFIQHREGRIATSTLVRYRGLYKREIKNSIGHIRGPDLTKSHVIPILQALGKRAPTQSERLRALLLAVMNHAVAIDILPFNPLLKIPHYGHTRIGERYLSEDEIKKYLRGTELFPPVERTYFRLLLYLGMRPGELAALKWSFVSNNLITIPSDYQKNSRTLILPLVKEISEEIKILEPISSHTDWLFPSPNESSWRKSFRKNKIKLQEKSEISDWTLRDIRRTTETHMRELQIAPEVVASILNHNTTRLQRIYDKSHRINEKHLAIRKWCSHLANL